MKRARATTVYNINERWPAETRAKLDEKEQKLAKISIESWKQSLHTMDAAMKISAHEKLIAGKGGELVIRIPPGARKTTYLYYGYEFAPGLVVVDGGERVTYDLPAFMAK